jgi:sulfur relay (sulfurtransferase) DsrC/TusE family protein
MNTYQLLDYLFEQKKYYKIFGLEPKVASSIKSKYKRGKLNMTYVYNLLKKAGYEVKEEAIWEVKS